MKHKFIEGTLVLFPDGRGNTLTGRVQEYIDRGCIEKDTLRVKVDTEYSIASHWHMDPRDVIKSYTVVDIDSMVNI